MRVFLIRHGETVDNVAGLYAGSRDSCLTNHGFLQATRLAQYFKSNGLVFTAVFSSQLQRAYKTAELIRQVQIPEPGGNSHVARSVTRLSILAEKHFGHYEGVSYIKRPDKSLRNDAEDTVKGTEATLDCEAPETKEAMAVRMDEFVEKHLIPLIDTNALVGGHCVAIVSHGIIMSVLWRRLISRLSPKSVSIVSDVLVNRNAPSLDHLPSWSNTGYLEFVLEMPTAKSFALPSQDESNRAAIAHLAVADPAVSVEMGQAMKPNTILRSCKLKVMAVNRVDHLKCLKRTGGGVGSSKHDEGQKSIESFFKKRKVV